MRARKKSEITRKLLWLVLIVVIFTIILNRQVILDFFRSITYSPSVEMLEIRENLKLTPRGEFLFNASRPELKTEEEFNSNCRSYDELAAVLGCYTEQKIYVYNVPSDELNGILGLSTAHELLHAVYERMSEAERDELKADLEKVYKDNYEILSEEVLNYDEAEQLEEIYVRAGTEIKNLPEKLERHFAEIFIYQDKIVSFYESYIEVFRKLEQEFKDLEAEMAELNRLVDAKTAEYENGVLNLNSEIAGFNDCANTAGCFTSDYEFLRRRNELLSWQNSLEALYGEISGLIEKYNANAVKYNNNVVRHENLQNLINSHVRVEGL